MSALSIFNTAIDALVTPFSTTPPVVDLFIISLVSAVVLLAVFKKLSNQEKIKVHKNKVFGHFIEIALYRDDFRRSILNQFSILKHNLLYMRYFAVPILLLSLPMILVCMQLEYRLGYKALETGDSFIIHAQLDPKYSSNNEAAEVAIETSEGIALETNQVFDRDGGNIYWRAKLNDTRDIDFVKISVSGLKEPVTKIIAANNSKPKRFSAEKNKLQTLNDILYCGEDPISPEAPFRSIRVAYQPAEYPFFVWNFSAIIYYVLLTILLGFCVKPFMKVNI